MSKKLVILILFLFLSSCGYDAVYSKRNTDNYEFSIDSLNFIGDRNINLKIKEKLRNYTSNKKDKIFTLKISSTLEKLILAKDTSGDPTSFKSTIIVDVEISTNNKFKKNLQIVEDFNYDTNTDKFELKSYEREIVNNLVSTITDELIYKLANSP